MIIFQQIFLWVLQFLIIFKQFTSFFLSVSCKLVKDRQEFQVNVKKMSGSGTKYRYEVSSTETRTVRTKQCFKFSDFFWKHEWRSEFQDWVQISAHFRTQNHNAIFNTKKVWFFLKYIDSILIDLFTYFSKKLLDLAKEKYHGNLLLVLSTRRKHMRQHQ